MLIEEQESLEEKHVIILGDFAENYSFVVQDEVQGFHWNNLQCTPHPVVVYFKDGVLESISYCIISDDNKHDVGMIYQVQKEALADLTERLSNWALQLIFQMAAQANIRIAKTYINCVTIKSTSM